MKVTNRQLAETVLSGLMAGKSSASVVRSLAAYLVAERRSKDVEAIMRLVAGLLQEHHGQLELSVTTARGLSAELKRDVEKLFKSSAKTVKINETINPAVIGGVKVESATSRLDLTIHRRLQRLKEMGVA